MNIIRIIVLASILLQASSCVTNPLAKAARYHNLGHYEQAIETYSELLSDANFTKKHLEYRLYTYRGNSYYKSGQNVKAIADYSKAISLNTNFAQAHHNRGLVFKKTEQYDQALADMNKAIALNPEYYQAYVSRGETYEMTGQFNRALSDYDKAIVLEPNYTYAYIIRGNFYWKFKQYDMAIANYDTAIVLSPDQSQVFANRGYALFYSGRYQEAAEDFETISQFEDDEFASLYGMLWYYLAVERQGKNGKAAIKEKSKWLDLQQWPGPLISLYIGEVSPTKVIENIPTKDKEWESQYKCIAYFHIGQYFLFQEERSLAIDMFQKAASFKSSFFNELAGANEELVRLLQMPI